MATKLAQSCRKSPVVAATPRTPNTSAPSPSAQRAAARAAEAVEVKRLLSLAQPATAKMFQYISAQARASGIREFLPKAANDRGAYDQLVYLRKKHHRSELLWADYALLARVPHVLGDSVYGTVERHEERAWRWSFAAAGVDVRSEAFGAETAAVDDLRELQLMLFPAWLQTDQRSSHLEHLLQSRAQRRQLDSLASRAPLVFASRRLRECAVAASCAPSGAVPRPFRGFSNLGNTCYLNAVTQCLFHCGPFQEDIERQAAGSSVLGDALKSLSG